MNIYKLVLVIFLCLVSLFIAAQKADSTRYYELIDSLHQVSFIDNKVTPFTVLELEENNGIRQLIKKGHHFYEGEQKDSAKFYYEKAMSISKKKNELVKFATLYEVFDTYQPDYDHQYILSNFLELQALGEKYNWDFWLANIHIQVSDIYYTSFYDSKGEEHMQKALKYAVNTKNRIALGDIFLAKAVLNLNTQKNDSAIGNFYKCIKYYKDVEATDGLFNSYQFLGLAYMRNGYEDSSYYYLNLSSSTAKANGDCRMILASWYYMGRHYYEFEKDQLAQPYFDSIINHAPCESIRYLYGTYNIIFRIHERYGRFKKALDNIKLTYSYKDSLNKQHEKGKLLEVQYSFDSKLKELELENSNKNTLLEQQKKKKIRDLSIISIISLVLISLGVIGLLRYRNRSLNAQNSLLVERKKINELNLIKKDLEVEKSKQERDLLELSEQKKTEELEHKKRELSAALMYNISKNEFSLNIKDQIEDALNKNEIDKKLLLKIRNDINYGINHEKDWKEFKIHFEKIHHNFFKRLIEAYPDLSSNELKMSAYLRVNLSSKEIAQLLNVTQAAINKRRNRLRKKLNLTENDDLIAFMIKY